MESTPHTADTYITADELFQRIVRTVDAEPQEALRLMHDTLALTCEAGLRDSKHDFGSLSSKLDALCRRCHLGAADTIAVQRARRHSYGDGSPSHDDVLADCRALSLLVSAVFGVSVPTSVTSRTPRIDKQSLTARRTARDYVRCRVHGWHDGLMQVEADADGSVALIDVDYHNTPEYIDLSYLDSLLREGMTLNLIDCTEHDGVLTPSLVVVEPDYLLDISSLAACFEDYGHHPLAYTVARLRERPNTKHTLLGNFAGRALDMIISHADCTTADILRDNFREKALEYATCADFNPAEFKREADRQVTNLRQIVGEIFTHYDRAEAVLEPSFVCERLGINGRVDLMTLDKRLLVEQKSGKNIYLERHTVNAHGAPYMEKHYVQVLLYYGVLKYNFGLPDGAVTAMLLYSRYPLPHGLMQVQSLKLLIREAMKLRNLVVANEYRVAQEGFQSVIDDITAETLNTEHLDEFFYNTYLRPQIEAVATPLHSLEPLERAYLCRMMTFVAKEQLMQKVGAKEGVGGSAADLWNMPLATKLETGNIYTALQIVERTKSDPRGGYDTIVLSVPQQDGDFLPNFRRGDMVYLYPYAEGCQPDARRSLLFKGVMADLRTDRVVVHLNDAQRNPRVLEGHQGGKRRTLFAIEHASSDIGGASAMRSVYQLATAPEHRRKVLLGQRAPRLDPRATLTRSYHPSYDDVLLRAKQAQDYFLLIGPPGTGKTSMALRYMVQEQLASDPQGNILLAAYTNRAVDEICAMLCAASIDFLRMGNEYSCDAQFRSHLIAQTVEDTPRLDAIKARLQGVRVVVGTTSTLMARPFVFALKHFRLAIVDEAGQLTEPNVVGLLAATSGYGSQEPCIDKFVLVGDYKQLPAVVQQSERESSVTDPLLTAIGLHNCRTSLFERLVGTERRAGRTAFVGVLRRQGRMHPGVAAFPSDSFYHDERLVPVPLPHQEATAMGYPVPPADDADRALCSHRMIMVPSAECGEGGASEKSNTDEARIVAVLLKRIHRLMGDSFNADKSVGVIVPYRNQIAMIRKELERLGTPELEQVSIDTVERYQGSQRDVIVYSFTVHHRYQLDFLTANSFDDNGHRVDRKLNVALTRARKQMIVTGNPQVVAQDPTFARLLRHISAQGGLLRL